MDQKNNIKTIIEKPIVTEKAMDEVEEGKYTFRVNTNVSKPELKKAIEKAFKVKVIKVNTLNYLGKGRKRGKTVGHTASWKKAVVTLEKGNKIELFEGV